jgi:hypothetical protein
VAAPISLVRIAELDHKRQPRRRTGRRRFEAEAEAPLRCESLSQCTRSRSTRALELAQEELLRAVIPHVLRELALEVVRLVVPDFARRGVERYMSSLSPSSIASW